MHLKHLHIALILGRINVGLKKFTRDILGPCKSLEREACGSGKHANDFRSAKAASVRSHGCVEKTVYDSVDKPLSGHPEQPKEGRRSHADVRDDILCFVMRFLLLDSWLD